MGQVFFYHLTQNSATQTLAALLPKARGAGWRIEIRGTRADVMEKLDLDLWLNPADGFLPHGLATGDNVADQPILLTTEPAGQGFHCLMAMDRAVVSITEAQALDRVCILFDGNNAQELDNARAQWKTLTDAGLSAVYWSEETGNWVKKASKN